MTCTFRNERNRGSIELVKEWVGTGGQTTLRIGTDQGGSQVDEQQTGPNGTGPLSTGANEVLAGTYFLQETGGLAGYSVADLECTGASASPSKINVINWSIDVAADETVVCTFTNTRDTASIELQKDWVGTAGNVTLNIGTSQGGSQVDSATANGADGTTGPNAVDTGTYYLSEVGDLADYAIGDLACTGAAGDPVEIDATDWSIDVAADETVVCTFTNTRDTASIELQKDWVGTAGNVTLNIGTSQGGSQVDSATANGADGTTGPNAVDTGTYYLSEVGDLADYAIGDLACTGAAGDPVEIDATDWSIDVAADETVVCTFTNTRDTASIELQKDWVGTAGNVTLNIGTSQGGSQVDSATANGADGTTGPNAVDTGTYYLSEVGDLADYAIGDLACTGAAGDPVEIDATDWSIDVAADETVVCTFTNYFRDISIEKSAEPAFYNEVGDEILYTIVVTNTGAATLHDVDVSDALIDGLGSWSCDPENPVAALAPNATITCQATYAITADDLEAGQVENTACVNTDELDEQCDSTTVLRSNLEIVKTSPVQYYDEVGDVITYTIVATNTGGATLTDVDVTDEFPDGLENWDCQPDVPVAQLAAGDSITCTAQHTIVPADIEAGSVFNTACADSNETPQVCDDVTVPYAAYEIEKSASVDYFTGPGQEIAYTVTLTNTGEATLTDVDISDALIDGLDDWACMVGDVETPMPVAELTSGQEITCTATYTTTEQDVENGSVFNQACASSEELDATCDEVDVPLAQLEIVKTANVDYFTGVGDEIEYTIVATNTGEADLTDVDISDALIDGLGSWSCDPAIPVASLAPNGTITCTATYVITADDIEAGSVLNTACADSVETDQVCDETTAELVSLTVTKTASVPQVDIKGDDVTFTYTVTNTSANDAVIVSLQDDKFGTLSGDADCQVGTVLAPGQTCEFEATFFVKPDVVADPPQDTLPHVNTFTACIERASGQQLPGEPTFCAEDTATVTLRRWLGHWWRTAPDRYAGPDGRRGRSRIRYHRHAELGHLGPALRQPHPQRRLGHPEAALLADLAGRLIQNRYGRVIDDLAVPIC